MATKGKILVLVSSGRGLPLKDGKVYAGAGYYLNELTVPVRALMAEGYEITFANPKGNTPQVDVNSEVAGFFGGDAAKLQDYMLFRDGLTGLRDPTRIADVIASGLDQFDAVFVPADPDKVSSFLNIRVADIHACYELWKSRGAEFITEPIRKYGEIRCYIRDPDGYIIEVGQSTDLT